MLAALLVFSLLVYGLACLVADAKIFGCPAKAFYQAPDDAAYIRESCQLVMRWQWCSHTVKLLLTCYLCLGAWCGGAIHLSLVGLFILDPTVPLLSSYPLLSSTLPGILIGTALAVVAGAVVCYILDLLVRVLENVVAAQDRAADEAEEAARLRVAEKLDVVARDDQ
jgi:hypothetical protein